MIQAILLKSFILLLFIVNCSFVRAQSSWQAAAAFINTRINDISFIPQTDVAWGVGDQGKIFTTNDGWDNWTVQESGTNKELLSVHFVDSIHGWTVGVNGIILATVDGGNNWVPQPSNQTGWLNSVYFVSPQHGFIVGDNSCFMVTHDGGNNWESSTPDVQDSYKAVYFYNDSIGWITGQTGTILKTIDGGNTWIVQSSGYFSAFHAIHFVNDQVGWAVGNGGLIIKTTNGGTSWGYQPSGTTGSLRSVHFDSPTHGCAVGWNSNQNNASNVLTTSDGGNTWVSHPTTSHENFYGGYFSTTTSGWVVGSSGTILQTSDGGNTWVAKSGANSGFLNSVFFLSDSLGWMVGNGVSERIYKTTDGGESWTHSGSMINSELYSVHFVSVTNGWVTGQNGVILATINGGDTWGAQSTGTTNDLVDSYFISQDIGWVVGEMGTILKTTNGGSSWTLQSSGTLEILRSVFFIDQNIGYVVGENGTILKTTNGGANWVVQIEGVYPSFQSIYFTSLNDGCAVGSSGTIVTTTDGGITWTPQPSGTTEHLSSVHFISPMRGWVVGNSGVILTSSDGGQNWVSYNSGEVSNYKSIHFSSSGRGCIVGQSVPLLFTCLTPDVLAFDQSHCEGATIEDLIATGVQGSTINWFHSAFGGFPIASDSILSSGSYFAEQSFEQCESELRILVNVGINNNSFDTIAISACDSYFSNGTNYTSSGLYTEMYTNALGCDSILTLDITIYSSYLDTEAVLSCNSFTWPANGLTYTSSGTYSVLYVGGLGCDSILTLNLTIIPSIELTYDSYSSPSDINNCNGNVAINISGNPDYISSINGGEPFNHSGYYVVDSLCSGIYSLHTIDLCGDSIASIFVIPSDSNYVFNNPFVDSLAIDSLGAISQNCEIYYNSIDTAFIDSIFSVGNVVTVVWNIIDANGSNYDTSVYEINNGNGVYLLQFSVFCPTKSLEDYFSVTEAIYYSFGDVSTAGIEETVGYSLRVFPNPTNNRVTIESDFDEILLQVIDISGKLIMESTVYGGDQIDLENFKDGLYYFRFISKYGTYVFPLVKKD